MSERRGHQSFGSSAGKAYIISEFQRTSSDVTSEKLHDKWCKAFQDLGIWGAGVCKGWGDACLKNE